MYCILRRRPMDRAGSCSYMRTAVPFVSASVLASPFFWNTLRAERVGGVIGRVVALRTGLCLELIVVVVVWCSSK
jgi:hypothetical protein